MEIKVTDVGGVRVIEISGRIDSLTAPSLDAKLTSELTAGKSRLVADMGGVTYLSSAGLRALLVGARLAEQSGGKLVVCGLSSRVGELFALSGFLSLLTVRTTRDEALAAAAA